ncbi:Grap2 and cyclin-D-interacting-domain-containing protein [Gaertneriomyces semiglobifer]|nr:Grap2 and cyclin-D-interacting-domain-containing protein [Gaertneriomyces semiglobifer]
MSNPELDAALNSLIDTALGYIQTLQESPSATASSDVVYDEKFFRTQLADSGKVLGHYSTKLSLVGKTGSKDAPKLAKELSKVIGHVVACVMSVPAAAGNTVRTELSSVTTTLLHSTVRFANSFLESPREVGGGTRVDYLGSTGLIWDICKQLESVSLSNAECVQKVVRRNEALVCDCIEEIEGFLNGDDIDDLDDGWDDLINEDDHITDGEEKTALSALEKELVNNSLIISKAGRMLLKKILSILNKPAHKTEDVDMEYVTALDTVSTLSSDLSRHLDDMASLFTCPIPMNDIVGDLSNVVSTCKEIVNTAKLVADRHEKSGEDKDGKDVKWLEMCKGQVEKVWERTKGTETAR